MKAAKTVFLCSNCGNETPRWQGRCPSCGAWNTMTEDVVAEPAKSSSGRAAAPVRVTGQTSLKPLKLKNVSTTEEKSRIVTGIAELDRVLGGGIVLGSVILIGGEPGIGKSTILLQLCGEVSRTRSVLYVTGEESVRQIKLRAVRLDVPQVTLLSYELKKAGLPLPDGILTTEELKKELLALKTGSKGNGN